MEKTAEKLKVNESLLKTVLCSATFWGLLAHGMVLFNKYSFHDDVRYFNEVGATYESGPVSYTHLTLPTTERV